VHCTPLSARRAARLHALFMERQTERNNLRALGHTSVLFALQNHVEAKLPKADLKASKHQECQLSLVQHTLVPNKLPEGRCYALHKHAALLCSTAQLFCKRSIAQMHWWSKLQRGLIWPCSNMLLGGLLLISWVFSALNPPILTARRRLISS
jgi:hypothetical protein